MEKHHIAEDFLLDGLVDCNDEETCDGGEVRVGAIIVLNNGVLEDHWK
jgi:hypothetical protein